MYELIPDEYCKACDGLGDLYHNPCPWCYAEEGDEDDELFFEDI